MKRKFFRFAILVLVVINILPAVPAAAADWEVGISSSSAVTAVPSSKPVDAEDTFRDKVFQLINQERADHQLGELKRTDTLDTMAGIRAKESSVSFSHTRPNGMTPASLFKQYKLSYSSAGENLAYGFNTPAELVEAWMQSPEHCSNILNSKFCCTGMGFYENSDGAIYCVQIFQQP